jgi:hypothetical protein
MANKQWEYGQIFVPKPDVFGGLPKNPLDLRKITRAGIAGWELVSTVPFTVGQGEIKGTFFILKREATEENRDSDEL